MPRFLVDSGFHGCPSGECTIQTPGRLTEMTITCPKSITRLDVVLVALIVERTRTITVWGLPLLALSHAPLKHEGATPGFQYV